MEKEKLSFKKFVVVLFIAAFLINLLWEVSHSLLYNWNLFPLKNDIYFYVPRILRAALGDAITISIMFFINCIFRKGFYWINSIKGKDYLAFIFLGLIFAIGVEINAMMNNLWSYNEYMPLVLGIGLTPLIQLALTGIVSLDLTNRFVGRK